MWVRRALGFNVLGVAIIGELVASAMVLLMP